jgi:hypothetical protein
VFLLEIRTERKGGRRRWTHAVGDVTSDAEDVVNSVAAGTADTWLILRSASTTATLTAAGMPSLFPAATHQPHCVC